MTLLGVGSVPDCDAAIRGIVQACQEVARTRQAAGSAAAARRATVRAEWPTLFRFGHTRLAAMIGGGLVSPSALKQYVADLPQRPARGPHTGGAAGPLEDAAVDRVRDACVAARDADVGFRAALNRRRAVLRESVWVVDALGPAGVVRRVGGLVGEGTVRAAVADLRRVT